MKLVCLSVPLLAHALRRVVGRENAHSSTRRESAMLGLWLGSGDNKGSNA